MRASRLTIGVAAWIVIGGVAFLLFSTERNIAARRSAFQTFDDRAADVTATLHEAEAAQQAYVAVEQDAEPRVGALVDAASARVEAMHSLAFDNRTRLALAEAESRIRALGDVDRRIRDYVTSGERLMANDVIFGEGRKTAGEAIRFVGDARQAERLASTSVEASARDLQISALAGAAALVALIVGLLATARVPQPPDTVEVGHDALSPIAPEPRPAMADETIARVTDETRLPVTGRSGGPVGSETADRTIDADLQRDGNRRSEYGTDLKAVAELCTELGRASTAGHLQNLLARLATGMEASGLVVWLVDADSGNLRPVLAYGYSEQTLTRMAEIPPSADNAAAAAYRTGALQIVRSRSTDVSSAIVAPLLSCEGCIGVLTAEISGSIKPSDALRAVATILAAQLAGTLTGSVSMAAGQTTESNVATA